MWCYSREELSKSGPIGIIINYTNNNDHDHDYEIYWSDTLDIGHYSKYSFKNTACDGLIKKL